MRIINLIDNLSPVNFGIWNAALATAPMLIDRHNCKSYAWYPALEDAPQLSQVEQRSFTAFGRTQMLEALKQGDFSPADTLIVSHGCWQFPTRWGHALHKMGYKWLMVPHGMLEPWSMQQKRFKKWLYFSLVERRLLAKADVIRAVGTPEFNNLQKMLSAKVALIPNGIPSLHQPLLEKPASPRHFLFMARLHHKKGLLPMVRAWLNSSLANNSLYQLTIAGPDDGELPALKGLLASSGVTNIHYVGAVYGAEKEVLLQRSHFYLLPSFSEGFPTSLLEAMQYGLIPLMTSGCNFPEALEAHLAIAITPETATILKGLNQAAKLSSGDLNNWGQKAAAFVNQHYNLNHIAELQYKLYKSLLGK